MTDVCERCGVAYEIGDWPFCPHGHGTGHVNGDACDFIAENGFHTPTRFTSKAEYARALDVQGLEVRVRHMPLPGTDKSPHTTDWSKGSIDAYTLASATALVERQGRATETPAVADVPMTWTIRELETE